MSRTYRIDKDAGGGDGVTLLKIGFGELAGNDQIVVDAKRAIAELNLPGGRLVKFDGPASLPVAMVLSHAVAHLYGAVAVYDPKLEKYVVCISHDAEFAVGDLID